MSARERILSAVRQSLGRDEPLSSAMAGALEARLERRRPHAQPAVGTDLLARFRDKLERAGSSVEVIAEMDEVPIAVTGYLKRQQLPAKVVASAGDPVDRVSWPPTLEIETRAARSDDLTSLTGAFSAIAETGTLMLLADVSHPTTLNFLPDHHIVLVRASQLVPHLEDAWSEFRRRRGAMPRTVNLVSGPSKTADVEQTIQLGAHGPRRLHVIVIEDRALRTTAP